MRRIVALDTNLLVLLIVGLTDLRHIKNHKKLSGYSTDDYMLLGTILNQFDEIIVTPNVLTEASNLTRQIREPAKSEIAATFADHIASPTLIELYVPSKQASARHEFQWLGLSDTALLDVDMPDAEVILLSADGGLCAAALNAGRNAWNFNHLRESTWSPFKSPV